MFDLLVKWRFDTEDLRINDIVVSLEAAEAVIYAIKARGRDLHDGLGPHLDQAEIFLERYQDYMKRLREGTLPGL